MSIEKLLGSNVKLLRKAKGFTQERLANQLDMSPAYFRSIEHGKANPSLKMLGRIAGCLGTTVNALISECEEVGGDDDIRRG